MATFEIQSGDGTYQVEAPDMETALKAIGGQIQTPASEPEKPVSQAKTGLFLSQNDKGEIGPGSIPKGVMDLMGKGYQPLATQPVSSEESPPGMDAPAIKSAYEAAAVPMTGPVGALGVFGRPIAGTKGALLASQVAARGNPAPGPGIQTARDALLAAAERQDVTVPRFIASESTVPKAVAGGLSGTPFLQDPIVNATRGMADDLGVRLETLARRYSPHGGDPQAAGGAARQGLSDWVSGGSAAQMATHYDALDKLIKPDTLVPLSKTRAYAGELTARDIESASPDGQKIIALVRDAVQRPGGLTYSGLKELRTRIGDRLSGDIVEQGTSAKMMNGLYGALSEDLKFGAGRAGLGVKGGGVKQATDAFESATSQARGIFEKRAQLAEVIGRDGEARPAEVFSRIMDLASSGSRGDTARLALARDSMGPAAWDEVKAASISRMGLDKDGNFSPTRFNTDYGPKRISDGARDILFGKDLRPALDDIALLSRAWEGSAKYGNPSGTGRSVAITAALAAIWLHPLALMGEVLGGHMVATALSKPATASATANYMRAYGQAAANPSPATTMLVTQQAGRMLQAMGVRDALSVAPNLAPQPKQPIEKPESRSTPKGPVRVKSIEEAVQLPKGTEFIDPNGIRRKAIFRNQPEAR